MALTAVFRSIKGRFFGMDEEGNLIVNRPGGFRQIIGASAYKRVTSAQVLALNATPQTVVAAPAAGWAIVPSLVAIHKPAGTAYGGIAAGEDLVLKYTNGSGAQCSSVIEATGFLDQTTAQTRVARFPASTGATAGDVTPVAAAAVVLHMLTGEITTGDSDLHVRVWFDVIKTAFTSNA